MDNLDVARASGRLLDRDCLAKPYDGDLSLLSST